MSSGEASAEPNVDDIVRDIESAIENLDQAVSEEPTFTGFQTELPEGAAQIDATSEAAQLAAPAPTPPPRRPKGRILIGSMMMVLFAAAFYIVWDGVFRYQAYGLVEASRVEIKATTSGIIQTVFVADGDTVRTGDLLLTINNLELEHRLQRNRDAIRLAEAQFDAHIAKLRRIGQQREWDVLDNAAEFFELAAQLPKHRAQVDRLEESLVRAEKVKQFDGLSDDQLDEIRFGLEAERGLLEQLTLAAEALQERNRKELSDENLDVAELRPTVVHIENLQNESQRLYELLTKTRIVAPLTGRIVKHDCIASKWVETSEVLLEVVEEGTLEPVVLLSQGDTRDVEPGSEITVHIEPTGKSLTCRVSRLGNEFRTPPPQLLRYYDQGEPLLPVHLEAPEDVQIRPGAMIKVPHAFERVFRLY